MAKNLEVSVWLDFYGELLTEKQRLLVGYYYNDDLSLSEIAENEGITRQGVRDAIKRAETQLAQMEEKLGFAARYHKSEQLAAQIRAAAKEIAQLNGRLSGSREIHQRAEKIYDWAEEML